MGNDRVRMHIELDSVRELMMQSSHCFVGSTELANSLGKMRQAFARSIHVTLLMAVTCMQHEDTRFETSNTLYPSSTHIACTTVTGVNCKLCMAGLIFDEANRADSYKPSDICIPRLHTTIHASQLSCNMRGYRTNATRGGVYGTADRRSVPQCDPC